MYNLVVHLTECKPNSTIASARVARFIVDTLKEDRFNLVDTCHAAKLALYNMPFSGINHLIIVNGPMAFCDFLPELGELVSMAKRVIWVQQDYTINPPSANSDAQSPFRKAFADRKLRPEFWTTVKKNCQRPTDHYINWNQLTYDPQPFKQLPKIPSLMYYGAYREKREQDFEFYFANAAYLVQVSTTTIRGKKFKKLDDSIEIIEPFVGLANMPMASASLYIEDRKSHEEFHSPANRFYELLSAGIPIIFDVRTTKMLAEAGIIPKPEWVVRSQADVYAFINQSTERLDDIRFEQREMWQDDYVGKLRQRLLNVWQSYDKTGGM